MQDWAAAASVVVTNHPLTMQNRAQVLDIMHITDLWPGSDEMWVFWFELRIFLLPIKSFKT